MDNQSGPKSKSARKHGWPYSLLNALAILVIVGGVFGLIEHLAGQFREGSAPMLTLYGGIGCVMLGIVLFVLADLGARLVRIETTLGTLPSNDFADQQQPSDVGPTQRDPLE